ncbi:collagen alpha-1(I) chain-like [Falco cherrug]|uniref:collagen alpha-1(I) chain-like n=1 Tax=Falco cherrug TaxID=345164 RepID=UPI00247993A9|nr:collagen alpha-1(I) chain-like [Falco cherrug]
MVANGPINRNHRIVCAANTGPEPPPAPPCAAVVPLWGTKTRSHRAGPRAGLGHSCLPRAPPPSSRLSPRQFRGKGRTVGPGPAAAPGPGTAAGEGTAPYRQRQRARPSAPGWLCPASRTLATRLPAPEPGPGPAGCHNDDRGQAGPLRRCLEDCGRPEVLCEAFWPARHLGGFCGRCASGSAGPRGRAGPGRGSWGAAGAEGQGLCPVEGFRGGLCPSGAAAPTVTLVVMAALAPLVRCLDQKIVLQDGESAALAVWLIPVRSF